MPSSATDMTGEKGNEGKQEGGGVLNMSSKEALIDVRLRRVLRVSVNASNLAKDAAEASPTSPMGAMGSPGAGNDTPTVSLRGLEAVRWGGEE